MKVNTRGRGETHSTVIPGARNLHMDSSFWFMAAILHAPNNCLGCVLGEAVAEVGWDSLLHDAAEEAG